MTAASDTPLLEMPLLGAHLLGARSTRLAWIAALAICVYASFLASRSTLFDRDEPRFAQATVEMIANGNWSVPTFNGELRADKPILVYWLMSVPMRILGASAWAARFWSPVCLASSCLLLFFVGRRLFDARTGLLAMGLLGLAPLALMEGTVATTDALLLLCITSAMASLAYSILEGPRTGHFVVLAIAFAAGLLTKGPVGIAVPILSILVASWMLRRERLLGARYVLGVVIAALVGIGVFLAWAIPANDATNGEFARRGLGHHVIERVETPLEGHGGGFILSLPYYVPIVALGLLTGLMYLPAAISALTRGTVMNLRARALLVAWTAPCLVLMTFVSTKLPHYVLPIWPGLALACAAVIGAAERNELPDPDRRWLARGAWIFGGVASLLVLGLLVGAFLARFEGLVVPVLAIVAALGVSCAVAVRDHLHGRIRRGATVIILGTAVAWLVAVVVAMPVVERTKVGPRLALAIRELTPSVVPVARWKFVEPSLDFSLGRPPIREFASIDELKAWAAEATPAVLVIPRDQLTSLRDWFPGTTFRELAAVSGFNLSKGKPIELVALARNVPMVASR